MTLISVWLAPDCSDEYFLFYNLSQNIHSLKDTLHKLWILLGPLFKGPAPFSWYQKKGPLILYISCSISVQKFLTVLEISLQISFRGRTCSSLKGPHRMKIKGEYCLDLNSEQLLFYKALKNICRFRDTRVQSESHFAPKITNYVISNKYFIVFR